EPAADAAIPVERGTRGSPAGLRLSRADAVGGGGRRLLREAEKEPLRVLPGPSGVRGHDAAARISPRYRALSPAREGQLPAHAARLLRRGDGRGLDRPAGASAVGPARG